MAVRPFLVVEPCVAMALSLSLDSFRPCHMKRFLILLLMLLACSSAQARVFQLRFVSFTVSNDQVKVDVYAPFGEDHSGAFRPPTPFAFLKTAPRSRGANQIGIVAEGCVTSDYATLLKSVIDGEPDMTLAYFGGFGSEGLRTLIEAAPESLSSIARPWPNNALQRTEAGGGAFCVFSVLRRQPPPLSLSSLGGTRLFYAHEPYLCIPWHHFDCCAAHS